jgi:hypothetical protein
MCEKDANIGEQINNMCKHGANHMKRIEDMHICGFGHEYVKRLVESGEMPPIQCELCIIEWLCGDPVETCVNDDLTTQWYTQCIRPVKLWVNAYEALVLNMIPTKTSGCDQ